MLLMSPPTRAAPLPALFLPASFCARCRDASGWTNSEIAASRLLAAVHASFPWSGNRRRPTFRRPGVRREDVRFVPNAAPRSTRKIVSDITINYFPKPQQKPPVARPNDDDPPINPVVVFHRRRISRQPAQSSGEDPCRSVLHFCPPPRSARWLSLPPSPRRSARRKRP